MIGLTYDIDNITHGASKDPAPSSYDRQKSGKSIYKEISPEETDKSGTERYSCDVSELETALWQAENLRDMLQSDEMAMKIVGILSFGLRKSGELLAEAVYKWKLAKRDRKRAEGEAAIDGFHDYITLKKVTGVEIKSTDSIRSHYVNINENVLKAAEKEALYEAIVTQLESYKNQFMMAASGVNAMIKSKRGDNLISSIATPTADEPEEKL